MSILTFLSYTIAVSSTCLLGCLLCLYLLYFTAPSVIKQSLEKVLSLKRQISSFDFHGTFWIFTYCLLGICSAFQISVFKVLLFQVIIGLSLYSSFIIYVIYCFKHDQKNQRN